MCFVILVALLLAGCTNYVPFKDGPATERAPEFLGIQKPADAWARKATICRQRGGRMEYLQGDWHCLAPTQP